MLTDFIRPSDARWSEALAAGRHDIYDLPGYLALCARFEGAEPIGFYAGEEGRYCLVPLLRRTLPASLGAPDSWTDAISPYGYSGAVFSGGGDWARRAVRAFAGACADENIISVLVRLHPLLPAPEAALDSAGLRITHGETVAVDLTLPEAELRGNLRSGHRAEVRRLRANGYSVRVDDWPLYGRYMEIYRETMERLEADMRYRFPASYFGELRAALAPHLHLLSVMTPEGAVAAGGLFTEFQGIVQFHLSGTAEEYRKQAPSKLMLEYAILWAKAAGNRMLHLGGGLGAQEDSLFQFKSGFSKLRARFQTWRVIANAARYAEMVGAVQQPDSEGYFPAYRKAA